MSDWDEPPLWDKDEPEIPLPPEPESPESGLVLDFQVAAAVKFLRSIGYTVLAPNPDAEFRVRTDAPATAKAMEPVYNAGTQQDTVIRAVETAMQSSWGGLSDDEIEVITGISHQSASACRNLLVRKGLLTNSGKTRVNRYGNDAIVWERTDVQAKVKGWRP